MSTTKKLAVLIDADNISADVIEYLLLEINKFGIASVKRIYGDWTDTKLNKWKDTLLPYAITPIQQFAYTNGKNATDMAMVIDAMDLLYSNTFDGFCLVSSDSDFTRLASRIRENGIEVIGFGQNKTPEAFVKACDKFVRTELLMPVKEINPTPDSLQTTQAMPLASYQTITVKTGAITLSKPSAPPKISNNNIPSKIINLIKQACQAHADDDGWVKLGMIGTYMTQVMPDFDVRNYQFDKLSNLVKSIPKEFEVKLEGKTYAIKSKSRTQWSKEQLNTDQELMTLLCKSIEQHTKSNGWALFTDVINTIGKPKFSKYGYAKVSTLFKQIESIEMKEIAGKLCIKNTVKEKLTEKGRLRAKVYDFIDTSIANTGNANGGINTYELAIKIKSEPHLNFRKLGFNDVLDMIMNINPTVYEYVDDPNSLYQIIKKK